MIKKKNPILNWKKCESYLFKGLIDIIFNKKNIFRFGKVMHGDGVLGWVDGYKLRGIVMEREIHCHDCAASLGI